VNQKEEIKIETNKNETKKNKEKKATKIERRT
jgi:hypothetical protein